MRSKLKKLLLALAIAGGLVAFALFLFLNTPSSQFPPLPNPNGYDDFVKAGQSLAADVTDFREQSVETLRGLVATNAASLQLLRIGLSRTSSVPSAEVLTNLAGGQLVEISKLLRLLAADARLAELEGRTNDAARIYGENIRYGNQTSRGGFLLHRMVGVASEAIGDAGLARMAPMLECAAARPLIAQLEELDRTGVTWEEIRRLEWMYTRQELRKTLNPIRWVTDIWEARKVMNNVKGKHDNVDARRRLLLVELAMRCYLRDTGQAPARMEDLVPKYLTRVPTDPFTAQPFVFVPQGTNWTLYSVGPDRVDNGGQSVSRSPSGAAANNRKGDLRYDSPN